MALTAARCNCRAVCAIPFKRPSSDTRVRKPVVDVVGRERRQAGGRRDVGARRECAVAALLLLGQIPGEIELGGVGVRRVLEDRGAHQEHRRRVGLREDRLDRFALRLEPRRGRGGIEGRELLARGDCVRHRGVAGCHEARLLRHVLVHVVPAVFLHDHVEHRNGGVIFGRIGGDELAPKPGLKKIERGFRHLGRRQELGVVGVDDGVDADRGEGAVLVLVGRIDRVRALGLEQEQRARLLPLAEVLDGLKDREIRLHAFGRELLLDLLIEAVAQAAGERDGDAGKALLEVLDPAVMGAGRAGAVEHQRLLELGLLVQRVHALGMRERCATDGQRDERHQHPPRLRQGAHGRSSLGQVGLSYTFGIRPMAEKAEETGRSDRCKATTLIADCSSERAR